MNPPFKAQTDSMRYPDGPAERVYLSMMDIMGVAVHEIGGVDEAIPVT